MSNVEKAVSRETMRVMEQRRRAAKAEADRLEAEADDQKARADRLKAEADRLEAEADRLEAEADDQMTEADKQKARADRLKAEADRLEQLLAPTRLLDYISSIDQNVSSAFTMLQIPGMSEFCATAADGKFYPRHFRPWADFPSTHADMFDTLIRSFDADGGAYFPSVSATAAHGGVLSPVGASSLDLRPFIHLSIELPAAKIVNKYLEITNHPRVTEIWFQNHAYGYGLYNEEPSECSPAQSQGDGQGEEDQSEAFPDRWAFASVRDELSDVHILVAEYNAMLSGDKIRDVMSAPPSDDFFLQVAEQDGALTSEDVNAAGNVLMAEVLCHAYHCMITSGLEFGYVASADGLILLRVLEDAPDTLYYFWTTFPSNKTATTDTVVVRTPTPPEETGMAYLASLCIMAIDSKLRPANWISAIMDELQRWRSRIAKPSDGNQATSTRSFVVEPPTLPYCTQACLLGLCTGLPLDDKCPNVKLHAGAGGGTPGSHVLTASELRARVLAQLTDNMDKDCECLDKYSCYGRFGVLFKITVTGYGYTLVAKAVRGKHRFVLERETAVYDGLRAFQGRLIPVWVGLIDLKRCIPLRTCANVAHLMLMSYAGPDLSKDSFQVNKAVFSAWTEVDWTAEAKRTCRELAAAGLYDDDPRERNVAWNEETGRVMQFDFDQATLKRVATKPLPQPSPLSQPQPCSPLLGKRDNSYESGESPLTNTKRPRAAT